MFIHYQKCRIHPPTPEPVGVGDACPITQHLQTTSKVLGAQFFGTIALMEFVLKARANSSASQYVASSQRSSPQLFPKVSLPSTLSSLPYRSFPRSFSHSLPPVHPLITPVSLLPTGALPKLFPMFPHRPPCRHSRIAPSHRSSPQAISHGFPTVHFPPELSPHAILPYRSFPPELSPSYFPRLPFRPPCVVTPVSPLPTGALSKLFPTASLPSTLSSLPYRSFPPELSPSYFPRLPFRPPCRHYRIAPSHRSSPQAISHRFPSVHPLVTPVSLLPTGVLPMLFPTVSSACARLFSFAAGPRKSYWCGCIKAATVICQQIFPILALAMHVLQK